MADPRVITESKSSSLNLQARNNSSHKEPSEQAINYFNSQSLLNKNQSISLARDAVANKMSGAVALGATATFPTAIPKLPTINFSVPKSLNTIKLNPLTLGTTALLYSEPLGGDSYKKISSDLRLRISDDFSTEFEKRTGDKWQATGVSATPVVDKHFELVAFQGLSQKDANLIGLPTTFPIQPQVKPMEGFEAYQGDKLTKLKKPADNTQTIQSTHFPSNTDIPTAGLMESRNEEIKEQRERKIDQYLADKGHSVEINSREGVEGAGRQGDRYIDGKLTEYKTMLNVKNITSDGLSKSISRSAMNARGQAPNIFIDAREQTGMTEDIAERGIERAYGTDDVIFPTQKIQETRIIGNNFDIVKHRN